MLIKKLWYQLRDEYINIITLYWLFRHCSHHPVVGSTHQSFPDLFSGDLDKFCQPIPSPVDLQKKRILYTENSEYRVEDVYFQSSIQSFIPSSDTVILRHWIPAVENKHNLTIVGCDGIGQIGSGTFWRFAKNLVAEGIEVITMDAPYIYRRAPKGYKSGQLVAGGDLDHQLAVSRQSIIDLWTTIKSVQQEGRRVGLLGISYGGWLCLMGGLVAEDLEFIYALGPPVDLGTIVEEGGTIYRAYRKGLGYDKRDHQLNLHATRAITHRYWEPKLDPKNIHIWAAKHDRFVPNKRIDELVKLWGTQYEIFTDCHTGLATKKKYYELIAQRIIAEQETAKGESCYIENMNLVQSQ